MRRLRYSVPYIAGKNLPKDSDSAPCGAGQDNLVPPPSYPPFQSTRPLRGGTVFWRVSGAYGCISIPPPLAGRDGQQVQLPVRQLISIHPPFAGRDSDLAQKKTVQNIAYCTKSAFTLAVLSGFPALMRPFFLPNVHKFRCEPSEESLLAPRSHAYTIRTPSG